MTKERELLARAALVITQYSWNDDYKKETAYIRADIVDELIKALIAIGADQGDPKAVAIQALENYMEEK